MKILALFLVVLLTNPSVYASEMWITTVGLTNQDRLEKVAEEERSKIKDMDLDSIFDVELRSPISQKNLAELFENESQARKSSVAGDFSSALKLYEKLLKKLEGVPNVSGIEKITFSTFVHIAALKSLLRSTAANAAWSQAHAWAPRTKPSTSEFSPAIVQKYSELQTQRSGTIAVKTSDASLVFIDGHKLQTQELEGETYRFHVEPGWHQVEVLTGGAPWAIKNIEVHKSELVPVTLVPQPLVAGDCENPQYKGDPLPQKVRLLSDFGNGCERVYFEKTWYTMSGVRLENLNPGTDTSAITSQILEPPQRTKRLESLSPGPETQPKTPIETQTLTSQIPGPPKENNWLLSTVKSPWFWTGVAVVAGFVIASAQNQSPQTVLIPSHTSQ